MGRKEEVRVHRDLVLGTSEAMMMINMARRQHRKLVRG
jgi:hypothetical protein